MKRKSRQILAWVQVQQDAPVEFLLGTDLQKRLGFHLYEDDNPARLDSTPVDTPSDVAPEPKMDQTANVCLLEAVRVPARFERLVPAKKVGKLLGESLLFSPKPPRGSDGSLVMEDGLLWSGEQGMICVRNTGSQPVLLEKGEVLGSVESVDVIDMSDEVEMLCCRVQVARGQSEERGAHLFRSLPVDSWDVVKHERERLIDLILQYQDIFALDDSELGCAEGVSHVIDTGGEKPVKQYPRRVPFSLRGKVEEMINKMEDQGVIQASHSPWASPIVLVAKKDGSTRFCVDYRKLNSITKMDVYPLPRVDDLLDVLGNTQYFSTLDLASGYWQVKMDQSSQEKTAFATHVGLYEFQVMPFGLCNAPATFQRLMEKVLHGLVGKICLVYLDDVLVLGNNIVEHLDNLRQVWDRLRKAGLQLKPSKCHLLKKEIEYLGYVISPEGITTSPLKVSAVKEFPLPKDVTAVRSFLGLASYYRRFISNFSIIAGPLFDLLKKDATFHWSDDCQNAFQSLKDALSGPTVLAFPALAYLLY